MRRPRIWLVLLGAPVLAALVAWIWWTGTGLPTRSGTAHLPGLSAAVTVRFDAQGVPHVTAGNVLDLSSAIGWLHANDRMTQLELGRRSASGRLSEVFGELTVRVDTRARHLRLRESAERLFAASGPETRAMLEAYARGVNAWLEQQGSSLPSELVLLGIEPEPWTPADSLGFHMLMARDLSLYRDDEQRRFAWLGALGLERMRWLSGLADAAPAPEILALAAEQGRASAEDSEDPDDGGPSETEAPGDGSRGSNNWALGASLTRSGRPIVAGDPHLGLGLPALWFQATLRSPEYSATGMTLPGLPVIVIGQSQDLGWAFTNTELDVSDLYFEELNDAGDAVRRGDEWVPITTEVVTLATSDGDRTIELRSTDIGPFTPATPELPAHSLAWTGHLAFDPLATFTGLARATTVAEVDDAVRDFICPVQNIVVGLADGELYFTLLGLAPERGLGQGRLPLPGWDPAYRWRGLASHETKPRLVNPELDLLWTANNDVRPSNFVGAFSADPDTSFRRDRIFEALSARRKEVGALTPEDCLVVQQDAVSLYVASITGALGEALPNSKAERARRMLVEWDGEMRSDPAAVLFAVLDSRLASALFGEELRDLPRLASSTRRRAVARGLLEHPDIVPDVLAAAWDECVEQFGDDPDDWDYTDVHTWEAQHPLGVLPVLGRLFNRGPFPVAGSSTAIAAFTGRVSRPWHERVSHGPSMRFVADVGNPDGSLAVLPGGQSGHPFDEHYDDQLEPFLAGRAFPVLWSERAIGAGARSTLRLVP